MFKERENKERLSGKYMNISILEWILYSGASHYITFNFQALTNLPKLPKLVNVTTLTGCNIAVREAGTVDNGDGLVLKDVLYSPLFNCNLIYMQ